MGFGTCGEGQEVQEERALRPCTQAGAFGALAGNPADAFVPYAQVPRQDDSRAKGTNHLHSAVLPRPHRASCHHERVRAYLRVVLHQRFLCLPFWQGTAPRKLPLHGVCASGSVRHSMRREQVLSFHTARQAESRPAAEVQGQGASRPLVRYHRQRGRRSHRKLYQSMARQPLHERARPVREAAASRQGLFPLLR